MTPEKNMDLFKCRACLWVSLAVLTVAVKAVAEDLAIPAFPYVRGQAYHIPPETPVVR